VLFSPGQLQGVGAGVEAIVLDRIVAGPHPVEIGVATVAADQRFVAATAVELVGIAGALKRLRRAGATDP
jgi:hypothetical protein